MMQSFQSFSVCCGLGVRRAAMSSLTLLALLMCLVSCTPAGGSHHGRFQRSSDGRPNYITSTIESVTLHQGQTLVELPIGSRDNVYAGMFFRVYGSNNLIKGTIKIDEVIDADHSLARLVGELFDRNQALNKGDTVKENRHLGMLNSPDEVEDDARTVVKTRAADEKKDAKQYAGLRDNFQRELKKINEEHQQDLDILEKRHQRVVNRSQQSHSAALKNKDLEHLADLAALQSTLKKEGQQLLREERMKNDKRTRSLRTERDALDNQVQSLLTQEATLHKRVHSLVQEVSDTTIAYEKTIRAEVEARESLSVRIKNLERDLAGETPSGDVILSNDQNRNETILERLLRTTNERNKAIALVRILREQITGLDASIAQYSDKNTHLETYVADLEGSGQTQLISLAQMAQLEKTLQTTTLHLSAASLAQLESERALYDLAIRVLRIPKKDISSLEQLKNILRSQFQIQTPALQHTPGAK